MFEKCLTSRSVGNVGLAAAIYWASRQGYTVSIPITDSQPYDLVVDTGEKLLRVSVRTSRYTNRQGNYEVNLRTLGGNQSFHTAKKFDPDRVDALFALTGNGQAYMIPSREIAGTSTITPAVRYVGFRVE